MTERRDENNIRIVRIDNYRADVTRIFQADIFPCQASVERLVYAVAIGNIPAYASFACASVDDIGIGRRYGDAADRGDALMIKNRLPGNSGVRCFPDAAPDRSEIIHIGIVRNARRRESSSGSKRSD